MEIRNMISKSLERGKVDFSLWIEKDVSDTATPINACLLYTSRIFINARMIDRKAVISQKRCQSHTFGKILPIVPKPPTLFPYTTLFRSRIAPLYREKEMEIRNMISKSLERGKVDFSLWIEKDVSDTATPVSYTHLYPFNVFTPNCTPAGKDSKNPYSRVVSL